jgi:hypothetical protein
VLAAIFYFGAIVMPWKRKPLAVPFKPDVLRPPDFRRDDGVLTWNLDESPVQLMWLPAAGWRLLVVTTKAPIYASLPEGELFKLVKAYELKALT